jgi:hypothetical protein
MSSPIARFEAFMERLLETSIARILDSRLDESVIMRRLERVMESNQTMVNAEIYVPHMYYAYVNPVDYNALISKNKQINTVLSQYLTNLVSNRQFKTYARISSQRPVVGVQLVSDPACDLATIRIEFEHMPTANSESTDNFQAVQDTFSDSLLPTMLHTRQETFKHISSVYHLHITIQEQEYVKVVVISKTELTLGRENWNDIMLSDHMVSRDHARINYNNQRFYITDLQSSNGTTINGKKVTTPDTPIQVDDVIHIGNYVIQLKRIFNDE